MGILSVALQLSFGRIHDLRLINQVNLAILIENLLLNSGQIFIAFRWPKLWLTHRGHAFIRELNITIALKFPYEWSWIHHHDMNSIHRMTHGELFQGAIPNFVFNMHFFEFSWLISTIVHLIKVPYIFSLSIFQIWCSHLLFGYYWIIGLRLVKMKKVILCYKPRSCGLHFSVCKLHIYHLPIGIANCISWIRIILYERWIECLI